MSIIVPFFHRKACEVGEPVWGLGVTSVSEPPATRLLRWLLQPNEAPELTPPKVPMSRIAPFCQMNACVAAPRKVGAGILLMVEDPTTWPASFTYDASLPNPSPRVPISMISPSFQRTAWNWGQKG